MSQGLLRAGSPAPGFSLPRPADDEEDPERVREATEQADDDQLAMTTGAYTYTP